MSLMSARASDGIRALGTSFRYQVLYSSAEKVGLEMFTMERV